MTDHPDIPILDPAPPPAWLAASRRDFHDRMLAFYSSEYGGILTDPLHMNVPVDDHLVHRGDGVFETLRCIGGRLYCYHEHLERLFSSAEKIGLGSPWTPARIGHAILSTVRAAGEHDCQARVMLSRGPGSMGINPYDCPRPGLYILVHRALPPFMEQHPEGARIILTDRTPVKPGVYATIKSCNYLSNALLKKEAADRNVHFAINLDEQGFVAEGATENIGMLSGGVLLIPRGDRILSGTTMNRVLDLARAGLDEGWLSGIERADLSPADLTAADEVFIFGTTTDVTAVVEIDGRPAGRGRPGPVFRRLSGLLLGEQRSDNPYTVRAFA